MSAVNPANRQESVSGRLLQFFGVWKVQTGYGTFPLSKELQSKPTVECNGAMVSGWVKHGEVNHYHFIDEGLEDSK